ncbi:MAG: NAD(P)H-hydrate dehydratase [Tannerellaceae bacterium]|jgi:NAD(P)H-hydrate epimerase|nr:NAD(P)H-hydrate dehydratase [Tannerellaceae bacterium]
MIKIFTTGQVKELDAYTIEKEPVSSIDLTERAATLFVQEFVRRFSKQKRVVVFAGQGNNGADALAVSRLLIEESFRVETYLFNPTQRLSMDCAQNKQRLLEMERVEFTEVNKNVGFKPPLLGERDVVIDGLFGSGLSRPLEGGFAAMIGYINESSATVVAIDIPSGLFGEDNRANNPDAIIKADLTLAFSFPKLAFLLPENRQYVGEWKALDIGIHPDIIEKTPTPYHLVCEEDMGGIILPRDRFAHKGTFGHALLIAGSRGKMGASLLAAKSCLRMGAGLLTVHIPQCGEQILQTAFPEAMVSLDDHQEWFTSVPESSNYTAIGIGPGLGQSPVSATALEGLLQIIRKPVVLDADALNIIASNKEWLSLIPPRSILTPHPKEFDRLAGESSCGYERLLKAQSFAAEHMLYIVLKGAYTAICTPEGKMYFNGSGNPGMATAGSGDVLTGMILGLLAQGYEPEKAAVAAVFIHGTAGDLAAVFHSEESLIASDVIDMIGKAFKQLK